MINIVMTLSSVIRKRRASTRSASTPAGSVNRNIGRLLATSTMETERGSASRLVMSQDEAVSDIATPVSEQVVATQITENGRCEKAPQGEWLDSTASEVKRSPSLGRSTKAARLGAPAARRTLVGC